MLPSETMIWQPEFTDKTLSRKPGAVHNRLGEIRDRGLENQSYRASGLTLLTAAIALWNTVYIERAIESLKRKKLLINDQLLSHLSPLGWEHINLNGDYVWRNNLKLGTGKYRPLRSVDIESYKKQS